VARLAGEAMHLVLDRRAVARPDATDDPGIHRRAVKRSANDLVGALVGVRDPARQLARVQLAPAHEGEHRLGPVSWLHFQHEKSTLRASRRGGVPVFNRPTGSFSSRRRAARLRRPGHRLGPLRSCRANMDPAGEESTCGQDYRARPEPQPDLRDDANSAVPLDLNIVDRLLKQLEIRLVFQTTPDGLAIEHPIRLRSGRPNGGALGCVQSPELDARLIGGDRHCAAPSVDLLDEMTLADTPIEGLHDIWPRVSMLCVKSSVLHPSRAAASAASVPA